MEGQLDLNSGALAGVATEVTLPDLSVRGEVPAGLLGTLIRNGPNPLDGRFSGSGMLDWWPESAMLHGLRLEAGRVSYRNRWVRTRQWAEHSGQAHPPGYPDTNPNVNVIRHGGLDLALAEGGQPVIIGADLVSGVVPDVLAGGITAHPRIDPMSAELVWFRSDWSEPYLLYGVCDATGRMSVEQTVPLPGPAMMHDFAITERYSILLDLNVGYDLSLFELGLRIPIRWFDERGARLGILPREGGDVRWFDIEPCFIQHVANAYESGSETIVLDTVRYPRFLQLNEARTDFVANPLGELWRYEVDLKRGQVSERRILPLNVEMPRINETRQGRPYRYVYCVVQPIDREMRGVARIDLQTGEARCYLPPPGDQNSEPVFVSDPARPDAEAGGWLLFYQYRGATDTSDLVILDAEAPDADAVAVVELPVRVPAGFHGAWLPGSKEASV